MLSTPNVAMRPYMHCSEEIMADPKTALLVIDVQNDFCPGGQLAVNEGDQIVPLVNELMQDCDHVVLTQDWHPKDHTSLASNHAGADPFSVIEVSYGPQVLWPDHCIQDTAGAAFHPDLETARAQMVIRKGTNRMVDSYSAFFENDKKTSTGLHGYLQDLGITSLRLVGLALDFCVAYSALDAARLGYDVAVIEAAARGIDLDGSLAAALKDMRAQGVTIA